MAYSRVLRLTVTAIAVVCWAHSAGAVAGGLQGVPNVASAPNGRFVVAWSSNGQDGSAYGVFAQRFHKLAAFDDGNGEVDSLTDGLLILRYLFDFTGATLTSGAVDLDGCTRCDAAAIEPYLEGLI